MSRDPYRIAGPAVISFSGGRTSGYMLKHILDAHDGTLPGDVRIVFANTGKERPETLNFVQECGARWGVHIIWVEYDWDEPHRTRIVSHNSAARDGEPFEALIDRKGFVPNPRMRFCTSFLKRDRIDSYARHWLGWASWSSVLGLRADEPKRVHRQRSCSGRRRTGATVQLPLADAGVTEAHVLDWWADQPFDLALKSHEGNCDLCFLKARWKIEAIMRDQPDLSDWWIAQEAKPGKSSAKGHCADMRLFRIDREPYARLADQVERQGVLALPDPDIAPEADWEREDCVCTD